METAHRLLYHLIDWNPKTTHPPEEAAVLEKVAHDIQPDHLYEVGADGITLVPTGASVVYQICLDHIQQTGQKVPKPQLDSRVLALRVDDPTLYAEANATIAAASVSASNGSDIPAIIVEIKKHHKSLLLRAALMEAARSKRYQTDPDGAHAELLSRLQDMTGVGSNGSEPKVFSINDPEQVQRRLNLYAERANNPDGNRGLPLGWSEFDRKVGGLKPGQTMLVIAATKTGKSGFCVASLLNMALLEEAAGRDCHVVLANREMQNEWQQDRIEAMLMWRNEQMAQRRPVPSTRGRAAMADKIAKAALPQEEWEAYAQTLVELSQMKNKVWLVGPTAYDTLDDLSGIIARLKRKHPIRAVYVDAVGDQRLSRYGKFVDNDVQAQGSVMRRLERMAFELDVVVIGEVQERREEVDKRHVDVLDLAARAPSAMAQVACHVVRLWRVPGQPHLMECQVVASRFAESGWGFPLEMYEGDWFIREGPKGALQQAGAK